MSRFKDFAVKIIAKLAGLLVAVRQDAKIAAAFC
jgi:hypothetical protein